MPTGKRWYTQENCHMLYGMLQNPPIAPDEWKRCADLHREGYPERDDVSQRRQYNKLVKASKNHPTGDPNIPEDLDLARQVNRAIAARCNLGQDHEDDPDNMPPLPDAAIADAAADNEDESDDGGDDDADDADDAEYAIPERRCEKDAWLSPVEVTRACSLPLS